MRAQIQANRDAIVAMSRSLGLGEPYPTSMSELVAITEKEQVKRKRCDDNPFHGIRDPAAVKHFKVAFHPDNSARLRLHPEVAAANTRLMEQLLLSQKGR